VPEAEAMSEAWRFMSEAEAEAEWLWRLSQGGRGWESWRPRPEFGVSEAEAWRSEVMLSARPGGQRPWPMCQRSSV
jgi:hypothetical protein